MGQACTANSGLIYANAPFLGPHFLKLLNIPNKLPLGIRLDSDLIFARIFLHLRCHLTFAVIQKILDHGLDFSQDFQFAPKEFHTI